VVHCRGGVLVSLLSMVRTERPVVAALSKEAAAQRSATSTSSARSPEEVATEGALLALTSKLGRRPGRDPRRSTNDPLTATAPEEEWRRPAALLAPGFGRGGSASEQVGPDFDICVSKYSVVRAAPRPARRWARVRPAARAPRRRRRRRPRRPRPRRGRKRGEPRFGPCSNVPTTTNGAAFDDSASPPPHAAADACGRCSAPTLRERSILSSGDCSVRPRTLSIIFGLLPAREGLSLSSEVGILASGKARVPFHRDGGTSIAGTRVIAHKL
jgi:hypothetical protein